MAKDSDLKVDGDLVRALAALLEETGLREIEYAAGDRRIRVVRDGQPATLAVPMAAALPVSAVPAAVAAEAAGAIKAPMVGTAYLSPQPGAPPFIQPGDTVREGQVIMVIEAMKVMNQIPAPRSGTVKEILVADGAPVEYGQVLVILS
jgi:acetyl-CoA carboxylase biotin carboxyl carrier protein